MKDLSVFLKRLKDLIDEKVISINRLSKEIHCDNQAIARWFEGKYYPRHTTLIALSDYFKCSIDFLLGLSDIEEQALSPDFSMFKERFSFCRKQSALTE
jgi:transcriptional regulator with XRE-family HTH domain